MSTIFRGVTVASRVGTAASGITISLLLLLSPAASAMEPQSHEPQLQLGKYGAYVVVKEASKLAKARAQAAAPSPDTAVMVAAATIADTTSRPSSTPLAASEPDTAVADRELEREQAHDAAIEKQISQLMAAASLANATADQSNKMVSQLLLPVWIAAICALISAFFATRALFENRKSLKSIRARLHTISSFQKI